MSKAHHTRESKVWRRRVHERHTYIARFNGVIAHTAHGLTQRFAFIGVVMHQLSAGFDHSTADAHSGVGGGGAGHHFAHHRHSDGGGGGGVQHRRSGAGHGVHHSRHFGHLT